MNYLERLYALINKEGRTIKYGQLTNEDVDTLVSISICESGLSQASMMDGKSIQYPGVAIRVYATNYLNGFNLIESIKSEIKAAAKDVTSVIHVKDLESDITADKTKHVFKSIFKIIN